MGKIPEYWKKGNIIPIFKKKIKLEYLSRLIKTGILEKCGKVEVDISIKEGNDGYLITACWSDFT